MAATTTPRPTTILLVRHGATPTTGTVLPGRAPGLHLSGAGAAQAAAVAERIAELSRAAKRPVAAVYASPLERTLETAAPIARELGLRVRRTRGLLECDFGAWTGRKLATLAARREWQDVQHRPASFRFPDGESFLEMQARISGALDAIARDHPGRTVVAVSHADPIKAAVAATAGTPLDLFQRFTVAPCSVTALVKGPGASMVLAVNSTGSLTSLVPS